MSDALTLSALPPTYDETLEGLHRVAVHVLARRRHDLTGRFGLRPTPGGFGTAAAGPEHERLRTSGAWLLRERTGEVAVTDAHDLASATLATAALFAEVDLETPLDVGHDTPPVGDVDAPLGIDPAAARSIARWYSFGAAVLDEVLASAGVRAAASVAQIWPEHFDLGIDVATANGRVNLGASPGDGFDAQPYLYVGPWGADRPGDPAYWNAPFGAVLSYEDLRATLDPHAAAVAFLRRGMSM